MSPNLEMTLLPNNSRTAAIDCLAVCDVAASCWNQAATTHFKSSRFFVSPCICKFSSKSKVLPVTCHSDTALLIVILGARLTWVVNATPRTLYLREWAPVSIVQGAGWVIGPVVMVWWRENLLPPPGFEPRWMVQSVALSPYRWRCPGTLAE